MVIDASAILKTGHILTSIKSITYPNLNLSIRLPIAPETIRISPILNSGLNKNSPFLSDLKISVEVKRIATIAIRIKTKVLLLKRPNAAPVLVTYVIWRILFITGIESPTSSLR